MSYNYRTYPAHSLGLVARAGEIAGTGERLHLGDRVRLNSGGPVMLVVDCDGDRFVVAWSDAGKIREASFKRACLSYLPPFAISANASPPA